MQKYILEEFEKTRSLFDTILGDQRFLKTIEVAAQKGIQTLKEGKKIMLCGNGGSAADAQHLAAELVSKLCYDRPGLNAIALTTDTSALTAIGNDYGYDRLFLRQLQAQARSGDIFFGITTSGKSPNILNAFDSCGGLNVTSVALCGLGGELETRADLVLRAPSTHTPRIQECHILIGHMICAEVELQMFGHLAPDQA